MTTTTTDRPPTPDDVEPGAGSPRSGDALWRTIRGALIVLGAGIAGILALVILGAVLLGVRDNDSSATSTLGSGPGEPIGAISPEAGPAVAGSDVVDRFADAWEAADWDTVRAVSSDAVAATAREHFVDGLDVAIVDYTGQIHATDTVGGYLMLFTFSIADSADGYRMTSLDHAGFGADGGEQADPARPVEPAFISVDKPTSGALFTDGDAVRGTSSSDAIEYRLSAGDVVLSAGSAPVTDEGTFDIRIGFTNTCCIEMLLELFHPDGAVATAIPLAYPEGS